MAAVIKLQPGLLSGLAMWQGGRAFRQGGGR